MAATLTGVGILKQYFGDLKMEELKALNSQDRAHLAELAAVELGFRKEADPEKAGMSIYVKDA